MNSSNLNFKCDIYQLINDYNNRIIIIKLKCKKSKRKKNACAVDPPPPLPLPLPPFPALYPSIVRHM